MPALDLQLKERIYQFFEEHPGVVPDLYEFVEWLYDVLFWEKNEVVEIPTSITEKFPKELYSDYYEPKKVKEQ